MRFHQNYQKFLRWPKLKLILEIRLNNQEHSISIFAGIIPPSKELFKNLKMLFNWDKKSNN